MRKLIILFLLGVSLNVSAQTTPFWTSTSYKGAFPVTDGTTSTDWTNGWSNFDPENTNYPTTSSTISSDITTNTTLSGTVLLQNKIYVTNGATLTILPGTIIRGDKSTQATLIITKGCKIIAEGTQNLPIVFTSNESVGNRTEGDWGGLVILGQATNNQPGGVANIEGIVPTANTQYGGTNDDDNLQVLCKECHFTKTKAGPYNHDYIKLSDARSSHNEQVFDVLTSNTSSIKSFVETFFQNIKN